MSDDAQVQRNDNRGRDVVALCRCAAAAWSAGAEEVAERYAAAAVALIGTNERFIDNTVSEDAV